MFKNKSAKIIFYVAIAIACYAYFSGLFVDVTRDAAKYATVSKEIFQNGNFINLTIHGEPYDQKPPMLFWLGALGFSIGGISNFWFKLPVLLLVIAGIYWSFRLGSSLYSRRIGLLTGMLVFFSLIYSMYSMDIHTDTPLQAFVVLALWQLYEFIKTRKDRNWVFGFIAIGLAMLCKGPIGAAIPAFAVLGHILLKKDFRFLINYRWYLGIILAFVVASPALIGLWEQFGWEGIRFFFWENNVGRITGSYVHAKNDPIFYVHSLVYLFLPWTLLFFIAAFSEFRLLVKKRFQAAEYYTFAGIWIYFVILNASQSQLPNYIFSIVPLMAVLLAKWIDIALQEQKRLLKVFDGVQLAVVSILWILIGILMIYLFPTSSLFLVVMCLVAISSVIYIYIKVSEKISKLILPSVVTFTCLIVLLNTHVFPLMFSHQAPPKAARYFSENASKGDMLYNYKYGQYELFFYSEPQASQVYHKTEIERVAGIEGNWVFTGSEGFEDLQGLAFKPDTIIEYRHLSLNRGGRFINPKTRDVVLRPMYLLRY